MRRGGAFEPTPAQARRIVGAVRDGVRREDVARSHGIGSTTLARIIAEHAPELAWLQARGLVGVSDSKPRVASITPAGREALATARAKIARAQ